MTSSYRSRQIKSAEVNIGDHINLMQSPWTDAHGVYSCKPSSRPDFVAHAIRNAAGEYEQVGRKRFGIFRKRSKSTNSFCKESLLMITETHIIEIRSSQSNDFTGTVTFAIPIRQVAKLKFRRQDSISLFFKENPDEPLIYECQDSADAVNQIQRVLRGQGVKGEKINSGVDAAVNKAVHLIQEIQAQQAALQHDPTVKRVNQILDMYQQAAEEFEKAGDSRHEAVVAHSQKFLALTETANILNGT